MKERLRDFLKKNNMNARQFADEIGAQPSSISHILTGRNKPSIELLEKMLQAYPDLDMRYLISGQQSTEISRQSQVSDINEEKILEEEEEVMSPETHKEAEEGQEIDRVMLFYRNGTFSEYVPK